MTEREIPAATADDLALSLASLAELYGTDYPLVRVMETRACIRLAAHYKREAERAAKSKGSEVERVVAQAVEYRKEALRWVRAAIERHPDLKGLQTEIRSRIESTDTKEAVEPSPLNKARGDK